jgi:putative ABC transport system permease protein
VAALVLNRVIASMLFHVATTDALTYAAVAGLWVTVGLAACYFPARRAMQVDPMTALRSE